MQNISHKQPRQYIIGTKEYVDNDLIYFMQD